LRVVIIYRPLMLFFWAGAGFIGVGTVAGIRFLGFYLAGNGGGHIQSVILAALCILLGTMLWMMGIFSELISTNRKLLEKVNWRLQRINDEIGAGNTGGVRHTRAPLRD
jgi:hypothetical protein